MEESNAAGASGDHEIVRAKLVAPKPFLLGRALILLGAIVFSPFIGVYVSMMIGMVSKAQQEEAMWMQVEILPQIEPISGGTSLREPWSYTEPDMQTELGWMTSTELTNKVVEELALGKLLDQRSEEEAESWLRNRLSVHHPGGRLVDIGIYYPFDPDLAKRLTSTVATGYQDLRVHASQMRECTPFIPAPIGAGTREGRKAAPPSSPRQSGPGRGRAEKQFPIRVKRSEAPSIPGRGAAGVKKRFPISILKKYGRDV